MIALSLWKASVFTQCSMIQTRVIRGVEILKRLCTPYTMTPHNSNLLINIKRIHANLSHDKNGTQR